MTSASALTRPSTAFSNHQSTHNISTFRDVNNSNDNSVYNSTQNLLQTKRSFKDEEQLNTFSNI